MSESRNQTPFEQRAREVLEVSTAKLDGRTLSRLNQARQAALASGPKPASRWWRLYAPAGAAVAAVLAVMVWTGPSPDLNPSLAESNGSGSALEDIDLLADGEAPDFVADADDAEFYEWAAGEIES